MLVFLGSVQLLFDLPNSFMEYIFILMLLPTPSSFFPHLQTLLPGLHS